MSTHSHAATAGECVLCDGPCREPIVPRRVHPNYPLLDEATKEAIMAANDDTPAEPPVPPKRDRRAKRPREDRAERPSEDRSA